MGETERVETEQVEAKLFTEEEQRAAAHLMQLVVAHSKVNVPEPLAVSVLVMAAGQTCAALGWPEDALAGIEALARHAYRGHVAGNKERREPKQERGTRRARR